MEFLTLLKEEQIEVEIKETAITLKQKNAKGNFPLLKLTDFPLPPTIKESEQKISNELFLKNLPYVLFTAAKEETRPVLSGINFLVVDNNICLVATDGFRLSLIKSKKEGDFPNVLIPASFLEEVYRQARDEKDIFFSYSKEEKVVMFRIKNNRFYSRLIEGEFPPYEKVIPVDKKTTIILDKEEFLRNIKIISVFSKEASNIVVCEFIKGRLLMRPKVDGGGENSVEQDTEQEGEDQKIAFNHRFIIDFLNNINTEKIVVEILRSDAPAVFKVEKNNDFLHIIMPVRLQE